MDVVRERLTRTVGESYRTKTSFQPRLQAKFSTLVGMHKCYPGDALVVATCLIGLPAHAYRSRSQGGLGNCLGPAPPTVVTSPARPCTLKACLDEAFQVAPSRLGLPVVRVAHVAPPGDVVRPATCCPAVGLRLSASIGAAVHWLHL